MNELLLKIYHHLPAPAWVISLVVLAVVAIGVLLGLRMYASSRVAGETPAHSGVTPGQR